ncbi:hypothetical protein ACN4EK_25900 [Pantanalinema rosaneae CENA516]|uniref:hypothetical protein n=1 Tax=Pantanalinema rosaneae TaxID=1620701 RepID=UPI003D6ED20E
MKPLSIADILEQYEAFLLTQKPETQAKAIAAQTLTALTRYTLPGLGQPFPPGRKPTQTELAAAYDCLTQISTTRIVDLPDIQEQVFEQFAVPMASRYTYRSRLHALLRWAADQLWYPSNVEKLSQNLAPRKYHGFGNTKNKVITERKLLPAYALKEEDIPAPLHTELHAFYAFFTSPFSAHRKHDALKPRTVATYVEHMRRIFGWFHFHQGVALEDLTLALLVPKVALRHCPQREQALYEAEQAAEYLQDWVCRYLEFLTNERHYRSHASLIQALITIHALVRFQYVRETQDAKYNDIPAMLAIRSQLRPLQQKSYSDPRVADERKKWLELSEVFDRVVTPLRYECACHKANGELRSITAIAQSFQIFLLWGMLTFRPPRRQQEFRGLKIALSCPIQKPPGLVEGQWIHPLPLDRQQDKYCGYLYKDVDNIWYEDKMPESYKTGKTYGHQRLAVPNPTFPDGKCFYDYLEAFLYGYYRDAAGNWQSGGQVTTPKAGWQWHSLRLALHPNHNYVFCKRLQGTPHDTGSLYRLIQNSAHRLTGQMVTPHLLRDIYATWFLDQGYSESSVRSLAYAMAHSPEILRRIYDKRQPQQKVRTSQEKVLELVSQYVG